MKPRPGRSALAVLVTLLMAVVVGLLVGGLVYGRAQEEVLRDQAGKELESVTTLQARYLAAWRAERELDARLLANRPALLEAIETRRGSPELDAVFAALMRIGYASTALVDAGGQVVASVGRRAPELHPREAALLAEVTRTREAVWDDFHSRAGRLHLALVGPISRLGERPRGVVLLAPAPDATILPALATWPAPRETAESLLVRREGQDVVFLSGQRFSDAPPLTNRRPMTELDLPAVRAVLGAQAGVGRDYRGVRVLFAARQVVGSPWFVVSKVDEAEVLAPARARTAAAGAGGVVLLAAAALSALLWWRLREAQLEAARLAGEARAAEALRESEERFRRAVLQAPFPIMIHAEDGSVVALSGAWVAASGYALSDIPTISDWTERAYGERRGQVEAYIDTLYALDQPVEEGEYEIATRGGGTRTWDFSSAPLGRLSDGKRLVISMAKDVTERKRAEAALAAERERLAVTLRSIGDAVIATDTASRIVIMNGRAEELTGWSAEEAAGRPLAEVFHIINEQTRQRCEDPVEKVLATGRVVGLANHTALVARDGRERSIADSGAPIRDAGGRTLGVVLVFRDVTEEVLRDAALARAQRMESLAVLAGGIAHDFNNLLTGVLVNLSLALEDPGGPALAEILGEARDAAQRAKSLTQQLLTFSKGGAPVRRVADLRDVVRDTATFCARGWPGTCRLEVAEDLWPARADPDQVAQVVQNIVINAIEAMPRGGTVHVGAENVELGGDSPLLLPAGPYLRITIADDGPGVPAPVRERVFDPFFSTKAQGSGLGLSVCHSIVAKHDGRIALGPGIGPGARFEVHLPAVPEGVPRSAASSAGAARLKGRVLVMDDEESLRRAATRILTGAGCEVVTAPNGEEAVALYDEGRRAGRPFDAVILDLTVSGGMGGAAALAALKTVDPQVRAIVSSGYSNDPVMASHREHGFAAVLAKPYEPEEVRAVVGRIIAAG